MAHPANEIAKYLINKTANSEGGELISNLKLQKLLYYSQAYFYAKYEKPLFNEKIFAWHYGPVILEVYHNYKSFGKRGIPAEESNINLLKKEKDMTDEVFDYFGQFSALKLVSMTHAEKPWVDTELNQEITLSVMGEYFKKQLV